MTEILLGGLCAVLGLVLGGLVAQLLTAGKLSAARAESAAHAARSDQFSTELDKTRGEMTAGRAKNEELAAGLAASDADRTNLRQRLAEEAQRLTEIQTQFRTEFENLANRILEEKSAKFLTQNHDHLTILLDPLRQRLGEFRERVETIHTEDTKTTAALREQLQQLKDLNRQMSDEAASLTRALKGESKTQGSWGELILERILEKSGLQKGLEYETQASYRDDTGSRLMPDVVIHLPEGKHLIVDAKVSLIAYERFVTGQTDPIKQSALREHILSVRRHIDELSRKDYPGLPDLQSPDFVLMFIPVEPALHLALQQDEALFSDAFEKNVVLVSSSTLLVTLRAIESVWRRHKQTLNARKIAEQAGSLHDQFVLFVEALQDIGQRLDQARTSYDQALSRLSTGRGNLVKRTMALQKLGARTEKQLPASLTGQEE
ncbi:MAG: DNA recombination protein RmuC [Verrucomicrobiota bacterium]